MIGLLQRVREARVRIAGEVVGEIDVPAGMDAGQTNQLVSAAADDYAKPPRDPVPPAMTETPKP